MDPAALPQLYARTIAGRNIASSGALFAAALALAAAALAGWPAFAMANPEILSALNAARANGCAEASGSASALRENTPLSEAARRMAVAQLSLRDALQASDYRATRSTLIRISGKADGESIAQLVARQYCAHLVDSAYRDIGIHQQKRDTWIVLAAPFAPPAPEAADAVGRRVLELVNQARMQARMCGNTRFAVAGLLRPSVALSHTARAHAADMAKHGYLAHKGRDGSSPAERVTRGGYRWRSVGENIASGPTSAEAVVDGWIRSPEHCANVMAARFTEMGVAYAVNAASDGGIYWVQLFGAPR